MNFAKDFPDKLRASILASEVVGKKVRLKKRGKEFSGLCPFHNEKTPSFTVNDQKGFYHCFGCQAHGDIITFVMEKDHLEFKDAVIKLAQDHGIQIPYTNSLENNTKYQSRDLEIVEVINNFFEKNLYSKIAHDAREYLKSRGFNSNIAKKFHLGYAPNSYNALYDHLKNHGFSPDDMLNSGVIAKNDQGNFYDKMRNRVTFAITDKKNRPIAFGGRAIGSEMPKYLNSAETTIFKKSQTLYNFANARKFIFDEAYAIIVEGYIDTISLAVNGFENVVAGLGTAVSSEHLLQLFSITDKIIICLDGDNAGIKAAKRLLEISLPLINSKKNILFCFLPNQLDPDDFIRKFGAAEFKKVINNALPLSEAMLNFAVQDLNIDQNLKISPENKARLEYELSAKINLINDFATKKYFNLFIKDALFKIGKNDKKPNLLNIKKPSINTEAQSLKIATMKSLEILAFLIKYPSLVNYRDKEFDLREMDFNDDKISNLKEFIVNLIDENCQNPLEELEKSDFKHYNSFLKRIVDRLSNDKTNIEQMFRIVLLEDLENKINTNLNKKEILEYKESLKESSVQLRNNLASESNNNQMVNLDKTIMEILNLNKNK